MEHDLSFKQLVNYQKLWIFSNSDLFKRRQTSKQFDGNWRYTQVSDADEWAEATRNELHPHTRCWSQVLIEQIDTWDIVIVHIVANF